MNSLLARLPDADLKRLLPALKTVPLRARQVLQKQHEPVPYVYFLNKSVASVMAPVAQGGMVEIRLVGSEGMLGIEALFTDWPVAAGEWIMQIIDSPSDATRLSVDAFRREYARQGALYRLMGDYLQIQLVELYQTAACNACHSVRERCCRWLLMAHDKMNRRPTFSLSQEYLAVMLGVARPTVTEVAGLLRQQRLIHYTHGQLTILDREGLERGSCECYAGIKFIVNRLCSERNAI